MSGQQGQTPTEGKVKPGDNPNTLNAKPRVGVRPKKKNMPAGQSTGSMRLNWIDPLPVVDAIHPLGLEPNIDSVPAGEITLDFTLPSTIARPFEDVVESVGDRLYLDDDQQRTIKDHLHAQSYFKGARQLYSTMLDHEKAANQPLKAIYYDEEPIPLHMAGALGIIGHMDTKVGQVLIRDAGVLFKRWVLKGTQIANSDFQPTLDAEKSIWKDRESFLAVQRLSREKIEDLVKLTYDLDVSGTVHTVSMPQLINQDLDTYYNSIHNQVPQADDLRACVTALQMSHRQWMDDQNIPHNHDRQDILDAIGLQWAEDLAPASSLRELFEDFTATHVTTVRAKIHAIFKTGPPPAGSQGYGAQTVSSKRTTAAWKMPLSDADVNIGFLFSPNQSFTLNPKLVGYSRRMKETAAAQFAASDGRAPII